MSLLLDALKEAEARKRGAAPPPPAAAPSFDTDGSLALAEDPVPQPEPARHSGAAATATAPAAAPVQSPADVLLAARATRAATPAAAAPTAPPPAARAASLPAPARNGLRWLIGVAGLLALLLGSLALYDSLANRAAPEFVGTRDALTQPVAPAVVNAMPELAPQTPPPSPALRAPSADSPTPRVENAPRRTRRSDNATTPAVSSSRATSRTTPSADDRLSISREPAPLAAAWAALQRGDTAQAETLYRSVLAAEPGQVDAELGLAVLAHARGADDAARAGYRRVLESVPDHPRAWAGLAELAGDGELDQIESRLRQLLASRSEAPLHFALGNILARQQSWSDAQLEYFAAASLEPRSADYAINVAIALDRIGKPAAALNWYRRALDLAATGRAARFDAATVRSRVTELEVASP